MATSSVRTTRSKLLVALAGLSAALTLTTVSTVAASGAATEHHPLGRPCSERTPAELHLGSRVVMALPAHRTTCTSRASRSEPSPDGQVDEQLGSGGQAPVFMGTTTTPGTVTITPVLWNVPGSQSFTVVQEHLIEQYVSDLGAAPSTTDALSVVDQYLGTSETAVTAGTPITDASAPQRSAGGCTALGTAPTGNPSYTTCITDSEINAELQHLFDANPSLTAGLDQLYTVLLPPGVELCLTGSTQTCSLNQANLSTGATFCDVHESATGVSSANGAIYTVDPYPILHGSINCATGESPNSDPGIDADLSGLTHEVAEAITDPCFPSGLTFSTAASTSQLDEVSDLCAYTYPPGDPGAAGAKWDQFIHGNRYFVQEIYSWSLGGCAPSASYGPAAVALTVPTSLVAGANVTITARVSPTATSTSATPPSGSVTIADTTTGASCTASITASTSTAACALTLSAVGVNHFAASYAGDLNYAPTTSGTATASVAQPAPRTPVLTFSVPSTLPVGTSQVAASLSVAGSPLGLSGTVTFSAGSAHCTASITSRPGAGSASCGLVLSMPGATQITASYAGTTAFLPVAVARRITVLKATTSTRLALSAPAVTFGHEQVERISVSLTPELPGVAPSGTVVVRAGTTVVCTGLANATGLSCTLRATQLRPSQVELVASYLGSPQFIGSTSAAVRLVIR